MAAIHSGFPSPLPIRHIARESIGWSLTLSIILILLGIVALAIPFIAGLAVEIWASWLFLFGGVMHLILAFHVRGAGAHLWEAVVGIIYIALGIFLFVHPVAGLVTLTFALAIYLLAKAIFELIAGFSLRGVRGSGWLLLDAAISIFLAVLIWTHLPSSAVWVIGTILGISILFSGITRLGLALAARRAHAALLA